MIEGSDRSASPSPPSTPPSEIKQVHINKSIFSGISLIATGIVVLNVGGFNNNKDLIISGIAVIIFGSLLTFGPCVRRKLCPSTKKIDLELGVTQRLLEQSKRQSTYQSLSDLEN